MKNLKTILIPAAVLVFGVGSAFATNKAKTEKKAEIGYYFDASAPNEKCIVVGEVDCNPTSGPVCTELVDGSPRVMQQFLSDTECGVTLHRN